jgi:DNA-binding response OmpR family regulator
MKKVLICEDEDAIRDFLTINLKRSGYTVEAVATG